MNRYSYILIDVCNNYYNAIILKNSRGFFNWQLVDILDIYQLVSRVCVGLKTIIIKLFLEYKVIEEYSWKMKSCQEKQIEVPQANL